MKKTFAVIMLCILLFSLFPFASFANVDHIYTHHYYAPHRDEYRADHTGLPAYTFKWFRTHFIASDNTVYTLDFDFYTGIMWLTCNGVYKFQFIDENENIMAESNEMITTSIQNPSCNSYPEQMGNDDLTAQYTDLGNGSYALDWSPLPGATSYEVWKDGQLVGQTTENFQNINSPGSVTIVARDSNGNVIGQSDMQVPTYDGDWYGGGGNGGSGGCDMCQKIIDALACPEWDVYMNEWEDTIRRALPPPPDWHHISNIFADTFVSAFDDWFGAMPSAPTVSQVSNRLPGIPQIDSSFNEAENLTPAVDGFEQPFDFDITDGEQIEIVDDSEPFVILEPLHDMDTSGIGVPVLPGDPANHAGGIDLPQGIETENPLPTPSETSPAPVVEMPVPNISENEAPVPGSGGNGVAVPNPTTGEIPIPEVIQ